jgi:hypothetical protein
VRIARHPADVVRSLKPALRVSNAQLQKPPTKPG